MKYILDPILGVEWRKRLGVVLVVANAALIVLQVAAEQLQGLPSWPWVTTVSAALSVVVVALTRLTTFGNRILPPEGEG